MKHALLALSLLAFGSAQAVTISGFTGAYAPANWSQFPGDGSVNTFNASTLSITSGDNGSGDTSYTDVFIQGGEATTYSFDWSYTTADENSAHDPFGYIYSTDGGFTYYFTQLTTDDLTTPQSGTGTYIADAGTIFGFSTFSDNFGGAATTVIGNFTANVVPEPSALALAATALFGLALLRRRSQR